MDCSLLGSSVHGIFQARILEWVSISCLQKHLQPVTRNPIVFPQMSESVQKVKNITSLNNERKLIIRGPVKLATPSEKAVVFNPLIVLCRNLHHLLSLPVSTGVSLCLTLGDKIMCVYVSVCVCVVVGMCGW